MIEHSVTLSKNDSPLKLTALERTRPSTSGRATFIAISLPDKPFSSASHTSSVDDEKITWNTGALLAALEVKGLSGASFSELRELTENAVLLRITVGGCSLKIASIVA